MCRYNHFLFFWTVADWVPLWDVLPQQYLQMTLLLQRQRCYLTINQLITLTSITELKPHLGTMLSLFSFSLPLQISIIHAWRMKKDHGPSQYVQIRPTLKQQTLPEVIFAYKETHIHSKFGGSRLLLSTAHFVGVQLIELS